MIQLGDLLIHERPSACLLFLKWFNGDGIVSAFTFKGGHIDFRQAYVRTEKYVKEAEARRALLGIYVYVWKS